MNRRNEGLRWFKEAEEEFITAKAAMDTKRFSAACFWAQQASEKALKGLLFLQGENLIFEHSVETLISYCEKYNPEFLSLHEKARILDRYYIPTRYPNGLPYPVVPSLFYNEKDASEAIEIASEIIRFVKEELNKVS